MDLLSSPSVTLILFLSLNSEFNIYPGVLFLVSFKERSPVKDAKKYACPLRHVCLSYRT
jgi:hypothetical protein